jgi:hypothetical protein
MTVPRGSSLSESVSSQIVYTLVSASPSQTYCLSDFALLVDTVTCPRKSRNCQQTDSTKLTIKKDMEAEYFPVIHGLGQKVQGNPKEVQVANQAPEATSSYTQENTLSATRKAE